LPPDPAGGRFWIAALLLGAMVIFPFTPLAKTVDGISKRFAESSKSETSDPSQWKVGAIKNVKVSVVTADYELLSCAAEAEFEGVHCEHKSESDRWPRAENEPLDDNKRLVIQPYRTWPDNVLISIAGLWAHPDVAMRLHNEPSAGIQNNKLARFIVECRLKFVGTLQQPKLRWFHGQPWQTEGSVIVGKAESCKIADESP
jgi:hypothetical protein